MPGAPAIKLNVSLGHQDVAAAAWTCDRSSFSFYLLRDKLSAHEVLHVFALRQSSWKIAISGSDSKGRAAAFLISSTYVPPAPRPPALPASAPLCTPGQISVRITGVGYVANWVNSYLRVSDTSSAPCSIEGWPTIEGIASSGGRVSAKRETTLAGPDGKLLTRPAPVILKKGVQDALSLLSFEPDCQYASNGVTVEKSNFTSLRATLPDNLGTTSIPSSVFNEGSLVLTPDSCYFASVKLFIRPEYTFFVPSFGEPSTAN